MILGEELAEAESPGLGERGDHFGGIEIVLRPDVLALEEELELGSQVRDPFLAAQDGIVPSHAEGPITR
jgi:hypothetical protein